MAARDRHRAFTRQAHPDLVALRFLSDYYRELTGKVAALNPGVIAASLEVNFPLADFAAGVELPELKAIQSRGTVVIGDEEAPLELVEYENRLSPRFTFSAYRQQGQLYFAGEEEDWQDVDQVRIEYTPEPVELASMDDELALLPESAYMACVAAMAAFFGGREGVDLYRPAQMAESAFLEEIRRSRRARRIPRSRRY